MNIIDAMHSEKIFRTLFKDLKTWKTWETCLKAIFGLPMGAQEFKTFKEYTGRKKRPTRQFGEVFLAIGRRGGKSFISALTAVFLSVFVDWRPQLAPGEIGYIVLIATDRKQASVLMNYIRAFLRLPAFKGMIKNEMREEIELSNNVNISVMTCSYKAIRGYQILVALCDEISFWSESGANPDREILNSIRPSLANADGSLLLCISTTYKKSGILWDMHSQKYGKEDPDVLVWRAGTRDMNETFKESVIKRALKEDYSSARAEFFSIYRADLETFLSVDAIDACIIPNRFELEKQKTRFDYLAFIDSSSGRGDAMSLSICHVEENGTIVQDLIRWKNPPFDPQICVKEFAEILESYAIKTVVGDRYAIGFIVSCFSDFGISYQTSDLSKSDIYLETLPLLMTKKVELLDCKEQTVELRSLERRTGREKDIVDHPKWGTDDIANACAGAIIFANSKDIKGGVYLGFSKKDMYGDRAGMIDELPGPKERSEIVAKEKKKGIISTNVYQPKE